MCVSVSCSNYETLKERHRSVRMKVKLIKAAVAADVAAASMSSLCQGRWTMIELEEPSLTVSSVRPGD